MSVLTPPAGSPDGYYPTFALPAWFDGPPALVALLSALAQERIWGIDPDARGGRRVEDTYEPVLDLLAHPTGAEVTHRRYVALGLALALASQAWIRRYTPDDTRSVALTDAVQRWLQTGEPLPGPRGEALYPLVATQHQHLDEDREVHRCLSRMPDEPENARQLLLDILDLALEGYAVFPGSQGRRDLYNWWLCQAVPAAYRERLPDHVYSGDWPWPPNARSAG